MDLADRSSAYMSRVMDVIGPRWSIAIVSLVFFGVRRFNQMQRNLGISRTTLANRLDNLVIHGLLERRQYRTAPDHHEYYLTDKGRELASPLIGMANWAEKHLAGKDGPPVVLRHDCGELARAKLVCAACGGEVTPYNVNPEPGPGVT